MQGFRATGNCCAAEKRGEVEVFVLINQWASTTDGEVDLMIVLLSWATFGELNIWESARRRRNENECRPVVTPGRSTCFALVRRETNILELLYQLLNHK